MMYDLLFPQLQSISNTHTRLESGALYCICTLLLSTTTELGIVFNVLEATEMHLVVNEESSTSMDQC
jgi:hypothetical protein